MAAARLVAPSATLLLAVAGCGGSTGPDESSSSNRFHMTARINDTAWVSTPVAAAARVTWLAPGRYIVQGVDQTGTNMTIDLANIRGPGTFPLGVGAHVPGGGVTMGPSWNTELSGDAGSITITTLAPTEMAGTFNFVALRAEPPYDNSVTRSVTDGDFDLPIKQTAAIGPIPDNAGSTLNATVGAARWNGASVQASLDNDALGTTLLHVTAWNTHTNFVREVGFWISGFTGPGTYLLSDATSDSSPMSGVFYFANLADDVDNAAGLWTSTGIGSRASVTVTSATASRIRGTFNATLGLFSGPNATTTVVVANGSFDIGLQ